MADLLTDLGKIAGVLAFLGYIPYLMSIVKRKTLPNPATWWIWSIMGGILFASYYLEGNREAIWVPLSYFIGPTVTGILSLKYGRNEFGNFEKYCLGGAAVSLVLWQVSGPVVALTMLIMIDLIAIAPTLRKTYFKPDSEDPLAWSIFWIANTLNLYVVIASESPTYATIAYPLELFFLPTSIMLLVIRGKVVGLPTAKKQQLTAAYVGPAATPNQPHHSASAASTVTFKEPNRDEFFDAPLDQLVRQGARKIISQAVAAELNELLTQQKTPQDRNSRPNSAKSSRTKNNESHEEKQSLEENTWLNGREETLSTVVSPDKATEQHDIKLIPQQLPAHLQTSHSPEDILPWLYLKGVPQSDFNNQLKNLLSTKAKPLPAAAISEMKAAWDSAHHNWQNRSLAQQRYVYLWADGIKMGHLEGTHPHLLVILGIRADGYTELIGLNTGDSTSVENWQSLLLQLQAQGLHHSPKIAVGNNQLGLWKALSQVFPTAQRQECWNSKTIEILQQLPSKLQPRANKALWEIYRAETRADAEEAIEQFVKAYRPKYPEAAACLTKDKEALLAFYGFPAEHWSSLRNSNLINSVFATLRMNTADQPRESLNQTMDIAAPWDLTPAAFKLVQSATTQWHRIQGVRYLGDIIEGISFIDGMQAKNTTEKSLGNQAAASADSSGQI